MGRDNPGRYRRMGRAACAHGQGRGENPYVAFNRPIDFRKLAWFEGWDEENARLEREGREALDRRIRTSTRFGGFSFSDLVLDVVRAERDYEANPSVANSDALSSAKDLLDDAVESLS